MTHRIKKFAAAILITAVFTAVDSAPARDSATTSTRQISAQQETTATFAMDTTTTAVAKTTSTTTAATTTSNTAGNTTATTAVKATKTSGTQPSVARQIPTSARPKTTATTALDTTTTDTQTSKTQNTDNATSVSQEKPKSIIADVPTSITLPGGLIYQVLKKGKGEKGTTSSRYLIHYTLYLTDGKKLESSRDIIFPVPFSFTPGQGEAIEGMEKGTIGMRVGEVRKLFVPSDMAYGDSAHGKVPPNSDLVFNVELVDLK